MAIFHSSSQVIGRSSGKSSVGASAYRAGEKIYNERDGLEHDYTKKDGVVYKQILTPENAPEWAKDRSKLWNEVERVEKRKDSQLAREINIALPNELNREQQVNLLKNYVQENFVSKGMIADTVIHDTGKGNPHAHIMLTMRDITQEGFGKKNREWNSKENVEKWREQLADHINKALEKVGIKDRVDHRSYKDQGIDKVATKHEGHVVRAMESRGIETDIGNYNRQALDKNKMLELVDRQLNIYEKQKGELEHGRFEVNGVRNEFVGGQGNSQDIGAKILFGNRPGTNTIPSGRSEKPITVDEGHTQSIQGGQATITKETSRERGREKETYQLDKSDFEASINGDIEVKRDKLQENRGSNEESIRGNQKESRQSQGVDQHYNGLSLSSEDHTESYMEGESKTILTSTSGHSGLDRGHNGDISTGNPFAEGLKSLGNAIEQEVAKEKVQGEQEKFKLERKMNKQPSKSKNLGHDDLEI
jgi:hypothetical protein